MNLGLNFLVQLRTLCQEEISKRDQNHHAADTEDVLSVRRNCKTSYRDKPHRDGNRQVKSNDADCVSRFPRKIVEQIPLKAEKSSDSDTKIYRCSRCDYFTKCHSDHINHEVWCTQSNPVGCPLCLEKCQTSALDDHIKSVHLTPDFFQRGDNGSYNCIKCNYTCKPFSIFKKHIVTLTHRGLDRCHICNITVSLSEMEIHQKESHGKVGDFFLCKICGLLYKSKGNLNRHLYTTHEKKQEFKCTECGISFVRHDTLKKHMKITHSERRDHICCFCNRGFKSNCTLQEHIKNIHSKNRHQCQVCFRGFDDKIDLDNHVLTHEGFSFRCMMCGKGFKTHSRREAHFQSHLNAAKKAKAAQALMGQKNHSIKLKKSYSNELCETKHPSPKVCERKAGDVLFPSNCGKPAKGDDNVKCDTGSFDSKESLKDTQVETSVSRKRKASLRENSENKHPKLDGIKKRRRCKTVISEVPSFKTANKCDNINNFDNDSKFETYQPGISKLFDGEKGRDIDESICGRTTIKIEKPIDNLPKKDSSSFVVVDNEQAIEMGSIDKENEYMWAGLYDVSNTGEETNHLGSPRFLQPCSTIPERYFVVDLNNLRGIDSDVASYSSLCPDSSIAESTVLIDLDNFRSKV